jgi:tRNA(adenine34) deaminase
MTAAAQSETDAHWMRQALSAARDAQQRGEVPVGTCIVVGDTVLAVAGNRTCTDNDPTAHAEMVALRAAAKESGNYRLSNAVVYSTIEPCVMCAGALIQARARRLVYGAHDERAGAVESRFRVCDTDFLNHRIEVVAGVLEEECREMMRAFFQARRKDQMSEVRDQRSEVRDQRSEVRDQRSE